MQTKLNIKTKESDEGKHILAVPVESTTPNCTGVTYNGTSMTLVKSGKRGKYWVWGNYKIIKPEERAMRASSIVIQMDPLERKKFKKLLDNNEK